MATHTTVNVSELKTFWTFSAEFFCSTHAKYRSIVSELTEDEINTQIDNILESINTVQLLLDYTSFIRQSIYSENIFLKGMWKQPEISESELYSQTRSIFNVETLIKWPSEIKLERENPKLNKYEITDLYYQSKKIANFEQIQEINLITKRKLLVHLLDKELFQLFKDWKIIELENEMADIQDMIRDLK